MDKCDICGELKEKKKFRRILEDNWEKIVVGALSGIIGALVLGAGLIVWDQSFAAKRQVGIVSSQLVPAKKEREENAENIEQLKQEISNLRNIVSTLKPREE